MHGTLSNETEEPAPRRFELGWKLADRYKKQRRLLASVRLVSRENFEAVLMKSMISEMKMVRSTLSTVVLLDLPELCDYLRMCQFPVKI